MTLHGSVRKAVGASAAHGVGHLAGGALILGATLVKTAVDGRPAPEVEAPVG